VKNRLARDKVSHSTTKSSERIKSQRRDKMLWPRLHKMHGSSRFVLSGMNIIFIESWKLDEISLEGSNLQSERAKAYGQYIGVIGLG